MISWVWRRCNAMLMEGRTPGEWWIKENVLKRIREVSLLSNGATHNTIRILRIIKALGIACKMNNRKDPMPIQWQFPATGVTKINTDRCSLGNLEKVGVGSVARDWNNNIKGVGVVALGNLTIYEAECKSIISAILFAPRKGWKKFMGGNGFRSNEINYHFR